jgi:hypothetical protein
MIGWFLENLMRIKRDYGLCIFAQSILPGFNEFCANLISICLYFDFTDLLIPENMHILRTDFQSISLALLAHQYQGSLMVNKKNNKRAALGPISASVINAKTTLSPDPIANQNKKRDTLPISASVINAKAILSPETITTITSLPMRTYGRKLAHRVQQWDSQSHDMDPAEKEYVLQKLMDMATKNWTMETGKFLSCPL